ncbi:hypothetical protein PG997_006655 [Apiospora hydei]|uniref:Uncharacterized protein n=1 Tax=Apiospora hydei TaxID=1337664 RepID=A0ABR1WS08_9PEZI
MESRPPGPATPDADALEVWYEAYRTSDPRIEGRDVIDQVLDDWLDWDEYGNQIRHLASHVALAEGFCTVCRHGLAEWPRNSDQTSSTLGKSILWTLQWQAERDASSVHSS